MSNFDGFSSTQVDIVNLGLALCHDDKTAQIAERLRKLSLED